MATQPSILAWRIPMDRGAGKLQSMESQRSDMTELPNTEQHSCSLGFLNVSFSFLSSRCQFLSSQLHLIFESSAGLLSLSAVSSKIKNISGRKATQCRGQSSTWTPESCVHNPQVFTNLVTLCCFQVCAHTHTHKVFCILACILNNSIHNLMLGCVWIIDSQYPVNREEDKFISKELTHVSGTLLSTLHILSHWLVKSLGNYIYKWENWVWGH